MQPLCRRWCNSSRSAEPLLVFYLLSLHACFCMVYVSARRSPNGFSSLDCVNNCTLPSNGKVSCCNQLVIPGPSASHPTPGPSASHPATQGDLPVVIIVPSVLVVLFSLAAANLYMIYKRRYTVSPSSPEEADDEDPGTQEETTPSPSLATAIDSPLKSIPQQANGSVTNLDQSRLWKSSILSPILSSFRKRPESTQSSPTPGDHMSTETVSLRRSEVKRATRNFSRKIGAGGFGPVYYGKLPGSGLEVAVKVHANNSRQGPCEFATEVEALSRARHPNLVSLIGHCEDSRAGSCMLIYEFLPGGTLQDRLYGRRSKPPLDWGTRLKIAVQAAKGLEYLHNDCVPSIIHRDVKSNNILLTKSGDPKLTDFGLCKSLEQTPLQCSVKGTSGYLDPEYYESMKLTHKSDVYSFGIVLLELISAREPADTDLPRDQWKLADWVRNNLVEEKLEAIVDKALDGNFNKQSMWLVAELAMTCVEPRSVHRPTMSQVVFELEAVTAADAHRPSIARSTPASTPDSFKSASSVAHQGQGSGITPSTPGSTPESFGTASSIVHH